MRPFIKWAGGKQNLIPKLDPLLPSALRRGSIHRYIEPFLGGGAMFMHVMSKYNVDECVLIDANQDLIDTYAAVRDRTDEIIDVLTDMQQAYWAAGDGGRAEMYYRVRDAFNSGLSDKAAYFIFLNKTCYNGLYRVNRSGKFNVPHGRYKRPRIVDPDNLRRVAELLRRCTLICGDFEQCVERVAPYTFIYFDPPYISINETSSFTSYTSGGFTYDDQLRLADTFARLAQMDHVYLTLSNSPPASALYQDFPIHYIHASRNINSDARRRTRVQEIVVTNYILESF